MSDAEMSAVEFVRMVREKSKLYAERTDIRWQKSKKTVLQEAYFHGAIESSRHYAEIAGDREPTSYGMSQHPESPPKPSANVDELIKGMLECIDKAAREFVSEWPSETYVKNDLPVFFEQGALWAIREVTPLINRESPPKFRLPTLDEAQEKLIENLTTWKTWLQRDGKTKITGEQVDSYTLGFDECLRWIEERNLEVTLTAGSESVKCTCCRGKGLIDPALDIRAEDKQYIVDLESRIAELERITSTSMGVGDGSGSLLIYGTHQAVKIVQGWLDREDKLQSRIVELESENRIGRAGWEKASQQFSKAEDMIRQLVEDLKKCSQDWEQAVGEVYERDAQIRKLEAEINRRVQDNIELQEQYKKGIP